MNRSRAALRGRAFVDTAPLAEKQLAVEAGLGWIGRQSLLVMPDLGSYVVLGELLLTDQTDRYDTPYAGSGCGACRRCVEHCPTGAIVSDRVVDTNRCIACHTIERQPAAEVTLDGWIFGCDACQSCCPYNRLSPRPGGHDARRVARHGRRGVRGPLRPHAPCTQRCGAHPGKRAAKPPPRKIAARHSSRMQRTGRPNPRGSVMFSLMRTLDRPKQ